MNHVGISCGFHDAAITVINHRGDIEFASHSERYSGIKHDLNLHHDLISAAQQHYTIAQFNYYEKPWLKYLRQLRSSENLMKKFHSVNNIKFPTWNNLLTPKIYEQLGKPKIKTHRHHLSHVAASFQTSPYTNATVVIIDAIGEFDCVSIWHAEYNHMGAAKYKLLWRQTYPDSIGLFYTAATIQAGLRGLDEEYILMGMAAYGTNAYVNQLEELFVDDYAEVSFKENLHAGLDINNSYFSNMYDLACSTQTVTEKFISIVMQKAKELGRSTNLVYGGGVALNCLANRNLHKQFNNIWIMPNPGDAGNSLGAAALSYGRKVNFTTASLGHNIQGDYPVEAIVKHLQEHKIVGVASGRAEFGPRALGYRSLLADPRGTEIKDRVNEIKRRQKFRPFAPMILEEFADKYFDIPKNWASTEYMQVVAKCHNPELFPAIVHYDGTSRIQTVKRGDSGPRRLLEAWYLATGCPMLLNTSLNIRGKSMVNTRQDADDFEREYGVKVYS